MTETENKLRQQVEWTRQHSLTRDQFKQLIANKTRRAADMQIAIKRREVLAKYR